MCARAQTRGRRQPGQRRLSLHEDAVRPGPRSGGCYARGVSEPRAVDLPSQSPVSGDDGVWDREVVVDGVRWARVEYAPGHGRGHWCDTPHCGYVVSGTIRYEFEDGREPLDVPAGEGFLLPVSPGHRGRNDGVEPAVLFIIDALPEQPSGGLADSGS